MHACKECQSDNLITTKTYKRTWYLCDDCGSGFPIQRNYYPLSWYPNPVFKKSADNDEEQYDYFVNEDHIAYSRDEAARFYKKYVEKGHLDINDKHILDVSGGNGVFLSEIVKKGAASGTLTEINDKAIDYAKNTLGLEAFKYNFNSDDISTLTNKKYDIVFLRACLMFCDHLPEFLKQVREVLADNGKVFVQYSVYPTLGTLLRTQVDEFSYATLRSPAMMRQHFEELGFGESFFEDEIDPDPYVYGNDQLDSWMFLHYLYEIPAIRKLRHAQQKFFRNRSRNRGNFIFTKER